MSHSLICDYCPAPAIVRAYNGNCSDGEDCCPTESLCSVHLEETKRAYSDILDSLKITPIGD